MTFKRGVALALGAAALVGCGGAGSFNGEVDGRPLSVQDAIFVESNANGVRSVWVLMSDNPEMCSLLKGGRYPKNTTSLNMFLARLDQNTFLGMDKGTFTAIDSAGDAQATGNYAIGYFEKGDSTCANSVVSTKAGLQSGTVTVADYKGGKDGYLNGTFDLTFGSSDRVKGSFNAEFCDTSNVNLDSLNCE